MDPVDLSRKLCAADKLILECPPQSLDFLPQSEASDPQLSPSPCNLHLTLYLQILVALQQQASGPMNNAPLLLSLRIAQLKLLILGRLDRLRRFLKDVFCAVSSSRASSPSELASLFAPLREYITSSQLFLPVPVETTSTGPSVEPPIRPRVSAAGPSRGNVYVPSGSSRSESRDAHTHDNTLDYNGNILDYNGNNTITTTALPLNTSIRARTNRSEPRQTTLPPTQSAHPLTTPNPLNVYINDLTLSDLTSLNENYTFDSVTHDRPFHPPASRGTPKYYRGSLRLLIDNFFFFSAQDYESIASIHNQIPCQDRGRY
ncbi:hypothetical protein M408DRAFT_331700 [Serendipita vermifera MAFF 305830]|uniref:Uncharacterized protein n=1 Tax=Serendipita vermifera MAFF 305830 TaxID=933852 RepID=A0A0C2X5H3_SERVB|nr:hypothetical protein M408DRAFT_331700 [Serendipita vermifera MAFF 305830]